MDKKLTVFITGACGTWGKEYTKQLLAQGHKVIGIDRAEMAIAEYRRLFPKAEIIMGDFDEVDFTNMGVDVLVHLAAYKHIDLCELNVAESVDNNISKTANLYVKAAKHGIKILFISTDKTIHPISVYGMSKALGERMTWAFGGAVARSGNIVGSNGSVIHIWREAIKNNKPLNVTDMNMERYFIAVEDAVRLSWEGYIAGNRLTIVDIGGRMKIGDMINKVLAEVGKTIETYEPGINIIGIREGERLIDEITWEYDFPYLPKK